MIKKILCPIDFSDASTNAVEYAVKVAQHLNASVTLLNIQPLYITEGVSLFAGNERESVREAKLTADKMDDYCKEINKLFKVSIAYEIIPAMGSMETAIAYEAENFDLLILGTNGVDNLYQYYFGTHSYKVAKRSRVPVLVIPDGTSYKEIDEIVLASDFHNEDALYLKQFKEFISGFNPKLRVVHLSEKETSDSLNAYNRFCNLVKSNLDENDSFTFQRIISENGADELDNFMLHSEADILAVCFIKQGFFGNLFHKNLVKYLTALENYPLLILHK